jgi:hypothetical protein
VISWLSPTIVGIYSVTITGTVTTGNGPQKASTTFLLTVSSNCYTSSEVITISPNTQSPVSV